MENLDKKGIPSSVRPNGNHYLGDISSQVYSHNSKLSQLEAKQHYELAYAATDLICFLL